MDANVSVASMTRIHVAVDKQLLSHTMEATGLVHERDVIELGLKAMLRTKLQKSPTGPSATDLDRQGQDRHQIAPSNHPVLGKRQAVFIDIRVRTGDGFGVLFQPFLSAFVRNGLGQTGLSCLRHVDAELSGCRQQCFRQRYVCGFFRDSGIRAGHGGAPGGLNLPMLTREHTRDNIANIRSSPPLN